MAGKEEVVPADQSDWRQVAQELYREAQAELNRPWRGTPPPDVDFLKEDLREALLDLKQAVADGREVDGRKYMQEVMLLLIELGLRFEEGSNA